MNEASIAMQVQAEVIVSLRAERNQLLARVGELESGLTAAHEEIKHQRLLIERLQKEKADAEAEVRRLTESTK